MNHHYSAECDLIRIRPLQRNDIEYLRQWRNDPGLSKYLSVISYISPEKQVEWFNRYLYDTDVVFFAVILKESDAIVGSLALYDIKAGRCEIGRIVIGDASAHGKGIGYRAMLLAIAIAVNKLGVDTIRLEVHEDNVPARKVYDKLGFRVVGSHPFIKGGNEMEMEITAAEYYRANPMAKEIQIREE